MQTFPFQTISLVLLIAFVTSRSAYTDTIMRRLLQEDSCFTCIMKNEGLVQERYNLTDIDGLYYSYCQYDGSSKCCQFYEDGEPMDNSEICSIGDCSNQIPVFNTSNLKSQYLFCNITIANDQICGNNRIVLNSLSSPEKALKIFYDSLYNPNMTTENQTDCNGTADCDNNSSSNTTNCTDPNSNCTPSTNGTNNTSNESTIANQTNNDTNTSSTTDNTTSNTTDNSNTTDADITANTTTNGTQSNDTASADNSSISADNTTANQSTANNGTESNSTTADTNETVSDVSNYNKTIVNLQDDPLRGGNRLLNSTQSTTTQEPIKLCQYFIDVADQFTNDEYELELQVNGYQQLIYFMNQNTQEITQLSNETSTFKIKPDEKLAMIGIFDLTQTLAVYVEYELESIPSNHEQAMTPVIIVAIVISVVAGVTIITVSIIFILRACSKKRNIIKLNNEIKLQKESQTVYAGEDKKALDIEQNRQLPKLSSRLVSSKALEKLEKAEQKEVFHTEQKGYDLTVEDINRRKSITSKSLNTHIEKVKRSRSRGSEMLKSGTNPIIGDNFSENQNMFDQDDSQKLPMKIGFDKDSQDSLQDIKGIKRSKTNKSSGGPNSGSNDPTKVGATRIITDDEENQIDKTNDSIRRRQKEEEDESPIHQVQQEISHQKLARPKTAKVKNDEDNLFHRRNSGPFQSALRQRPNANNSIVYEKDNQGENTHRKKRGFQRGFTSDVNEIKKTFNTITHENLESPSNNQNKHLEQSSTIDKNELFKKKLQIFQSESKFEDYEYMYDDEDEGQNDVRGQYDDDDEIKSGFHSDLKEQFQQTKMQKGILKNSNQPPEISRQQKVSKREEYQRKYDDYYQDANNIFFQTGTFNKDDDDDESKKSTLTINQYSDMKKQ